MKPRFQSSDGHGRRWLAESVFAENWVEVVLTLLALFYVTYRFIKLPLAPDEWSVFWSIRHHALADYFTTRNWSQDENAQQEFLPIFLSHVCYRLFRFAELQRIRLFSPVAFLAYLAGAWRIRRFFLARGIGLLVFVALTINAFVLDYFSVARSYSLTMPFILWSLIGLLETERTSSAGLLASGRVGWSIAASYAAMLAVVSNASTGYVYAPLVLLLVWLTRREGVAHLVAVSSSGLALGAFYLPRICTMFEHHASVFRMGGTGGFVSDTVLSLVKVAFYDGSPFWPYPTTGLERALAYVVAAVMAGLCVIAFRRRYRRCAILAGCLLGASAMAYLGHVALHVPFPIERSVMYFIPLSVLQIACIADSTPLRWFRLGLSGLLLAYSVTVAWGLNLTHMCISSVMADIPALVQDLTRIHQRNNNPVVLCVSDGTKWQVWYYAELATKVPKSERLQDHGCYAHIDWLYVYEPHCGHLTKEGWISTPTTTDLFLSSDDYPPTWFLHDTVLLREYPVSHWRLYGRVGDAIAHDKDSLQLMPDFADGHFSLGTVLMRDGKIEEAVVQFEQALQIKPDYAEAHNNLGSALLQTGNLTGAIEHYEQALHFKPDYAEAHNNLGSALLQAGKATEAIEHYEQALRLKLDPAETHNNLGLALARAGQVQEAITHYKEALRLKPDYANACFNLGLALEQIGALSDAIADYQQVLQINPDYPPAHFHLGQALEKLGRADEATDQYEQASRANPGDVATHVNLGNAFLRMGKMPEAVAEYEQVLRINPGLAEAHSNLGAILQRMGKLPEAVTQYELALQSKPDYAEAHFNLGLALEKLGRTAEAIQQYEQALKLRPDFLAARNASARLQTSQ